MYGYIIHSIMRGGRYKADIPINIMEVTNGLKWKKINYSLIGGFDLGLEGV